MQAGQVSTTTEPTSVTSEATWDGASAAPNCTAHDDGARDVSTRYRRSLTPPHFETPFTFLIGSALNQISQHQKLQSNLDAEYKDFFR